MIEWFLAALGVSASGLLLHRVVTRQKVKSYVSIGSLADAAGAVVSIEGRVSGSPTLSPVTWHPCAAWWCWVDTLRTDGEWDAVGAAARGELFIDDGSGRLKLDASECSVTNPPGAEVTMPMDHWPPVSASPFHDALRDVCRAAGLPNPDAVAAVRIRESLLPAGATVAAQGLVVLAPGDVDGGYRGETSAAATFCSPPGKLIELSPR